MARRSQAADEGREPIWVREAEHKAAEAHRRYTQAAATLAQMKAGEERGTRADRQALEETVVEYRREAEAADREARRAREAWMREERRAWEAEQRERRKSEARESSAGSRAALAAGRRDTRPSRRSYVFVEPGQGAAGRIIDLAPAGGAALVTTFFVGAQSFPTDMVWDLVAAFLGGLMAMEGTGELRNIGYGMFGGAVTYAGLRLTGSLGSHVV